LHTLPIPGELKQRVAIPCRGRAFVTPPMAGRFPCAREHWAVPTWASGRGGYRLTPVHVDDVTQIGIDAAMGEANPSAPRASPTGSK
jgi:hypothetical protein